MASHNTKYTLTVTKDETDDTFEQRTINDINRLYANRPLYCQVSPSPPISPPPPRSPLNYNNLQDDDEIQHAAFMLCHIRSSYNYNNTQNKKRSDTPPPNNRDNFYRHHKNKRFTLAIPEDSNNLNSLHCFVRRTLLEIYILEKHKHKNEIKFKKQKVALINQMEDKDIKDDDGDEEENKMGGDGKKNSSDRPMNAIKTSSIDVSAEPVRVGLRCAYCAHLPRKNRANMSMVHPKNISDLYRSVCTWQRVHFHRCPMIPIAVRETYWKLKREDKTRGKTTYWVESARKIGLMDCPDGRGMCFRDEYFYVGE